VSDLAELAEVFGLRCRRCGRAGADVLEHPAELRAFLHPQPLGQHEGAFLPCTCWLANFHFCAGDEDAGDALLDEIDRVAGPLGLLAEAVDTRSRTFLGNTPLVFSHTSYVRAALRLGPPHR